MKSNLSALNISNYLSFISIWLLNIKMHEQQKDFLLTYRHAIKSVGIVFVFNFNLI